MERPSVSTESGSEHWGRESPKDRGRRRRNRKKQGYLKKRPKSLRVQRGDARGGLRRGKEIRKKRVGAS